MESAGTAGWLSEVRREYIFTDGRIVAGVDVSQKYASASTWSCLKKAGYSFAIVRGYQSVCSPDPYVSLPNIPPPSPNEPPTYSFQLLFMNYEEIHSNRLSYHSKQSLQYPIKS